MSGCGKIVGMKNQPTINEILAVQLRYYMDKKAMNQPALAKASGVSQSSISNYLNPKNRIQASAQSSKAKEPSAKLSEIAMLAGALGVEVWELTRNISPSERAMYDRIEAAYKALIDHVD